uniref:PB1 domain-containing protein n=1 Tax=Mandrillus leucophaeus TaxID=9568 RepID=A0A2K5Z0T2_MANLE
EVEKEICSQAIQFHKESVEVKFGAEFRRFSLDRHKPGKFEDFYKLVVHTHHISNSDVTIGYADVHGDLLPINNDDNFCKAVSSANPLLRVFIQKRGTEVVEWLPGLVEQSFLKYSFPFFLSLHLVLFSNL